MIGSHGVPVEMFVRSISAPIAEVAVATALYRAGSCFQGTRSPDCRSGA